MRARCSVNPVMKASSTPEASVTPLVSLVTIPSRRWQTACVWLNPPCTLGGGFRWTVPPVAAGPWPPGTQTDLRCMSPVLRWLQRTRCVELHRVPGAAHAVWWRTLLELLWKWNSPWWRRHPPRVLQLLRIIRWTRRRVRWPQSPDSEDATHHTSHLFFSWMHPGGQLCVRPNWRFEGARRRRQQVCHHLCSAHPLHRLWHFHLPQPSGWIAQHPLQAQRRRLQEGGVQWWDCSQTCHLLLRGVQRLGGAVWRQGGGRWHRIHVKRWNSLPEVQVCTSNGWRGDWAGLWWRNVLLQIKKKNLDCDLLPETVENDWAQPQLDGGF